MNDPIACAAIGVIFNKRGTCPGPDRFQFTLTNLTMMSMLGRHVMRRGNYSTLPLTLVTCTVRRWQVKGLHARGFHAFVAKSFECTPSALDGRGRKSKVKFDKPYKCTHGGCDMGFWYSWWIGQASSTAWHVEETCLFILSTPIYAEAPSQDSWTDSYRREAIRVWWTRLWLCL